jgi:hypothetical protein
MNWLVPVLTLVVLSGGIAAAQGTTPPAAAAPETAPPVSQNVGVDVTVLEEGGQAPSSRKTTTLTIANSRNGSVRALTSTKPGEGNRFNVDALPVLQQGGRILAGITVEYQSPTSGPLLRLNMQPLLESGKKMVMSEAADPNSDRRVTVEVMATVLK